MPEPEVTIKERPKSRRWTKSSNPRAELVYLVRGTADENEVVTLAEATSPPYYQGIRRQETVVDPIHVDILLPLTCIWEVTFNYYNRSYNSSGSDDDHPPRFHLDTTGGAEHITEALFDSKRSKDAKDFGKTIGVGSDGRAEGVDIIVPKFQWSEEHWFSARKLTDSFLLHLYNLTGKVNSKHWRIFGPGECLFEGVVASWTDQDDGAMLTFRFNGSPDTTKNGVLKGGWDYYWERHVTKETGTGSDKDFGAEFAGAYASTVYKSADFIDLGIGR